MKTVNFFDLGYLDLIKAMFFGKKIRLGFDKPGFTGSRIPAESKASGHFEPNEVRGETGWTMGLPGHHP